MKARYFLLAALALTLAACEKETEQQKDFSFGFNVRNEDYAEELVLKGVGEAQIIDVENLPSWIPGVMLKDESVNGDPVAVIGVKGDINLEDTREARIVLKMSNGASVKLTLKQWPILKGGTNEVYKSENAAFEEDWSSAQMITLVTSFEYINGKPTKTTLEVPLPWAWDKSPECYLPKGDGRDKTMEVYKMIENKGDWSLVFNLTGIQNLPGRNYFGLYNRYTGVLRIFFYLTKDQVPLNDANDHLWSFSLNAALAEHLSSQFTIPRLEEVKTPILSRLAMPYLTSPTTDKYNPLSGQTSNVLAVGWWAFDVGMAAYRSHAFFSETPLNAANIQLCTYSEEHILMNSVIQGNLGGELKGSLNLDLLRPTKANLGASIGASVMGGFGTVFSNTYWLNEVCGKRAGGNVQNDQQAQNAQINNGGGGGGGGAEPGANNAAPRFVQTKGIIAGLCSILIGTALSVGAKYVANIGSETVTDENFGALNANLNLDLNAVMTTQGTIGAPTPNAVPPVALSMEYFREKNADDSYTCLGEGVWNLEKYPVIYVVKDAYWYDNKFSVISMQKEFPVGESGKYNSDVYSYYMGATKGSRPGLRLITFMDPTSVGGVAFNPKLFNDQFTDLGVYLSYGVYPGSKPGYTDGFRRDAGLDYPHSWRLHLIQDEKGKYLLDSLHLVRKVHTDELFKWAGVPAGTEEVAGIRLSSQKMRADHPALERRFCGASVYYCNPYADEFIVDEVQYVYDPQVFLPFDEVAHRLYDPVVPDFVVTATVNAYGKDEKDKDVCLLTNTLRFLPKIELISYKDVPRIYNEMTTRQGQMSGPDPSITYFKEMKDQVAHVGAIVEALKELTPPKQ